VHRSKCRHAALEIAAAEAKRVAGETNTFQESKGKQEDVVHQNRTPSPPPLSLCLCLSVCVSLHLLIQNPMTSVKTNLDLLPPGTVVYSMLVGPVL